MDFNSETAAEQMAPLANASVAKSVNLMSVLFAAVIVVGMLINKYSVTTAVLSGASFYGGIAALLVLAPHVTRIIINRQNQITIRHCAELPYRWSVQDEQPRVSVVDPVQLPYEAPALPESPSFVPAVPRIDDKVKVDAGNFVTQLFDSSNGRPLPSRITKNKRQIQWKSPSPEAVEYLMSLGIVEAGEGKQLYWSPHFPTLREALNAIRTGRRPSYQEAKEQGEEGQ
jgi:hypothetical protein